MNSTRAHHWVLGRPQSGAIEGVCLNSAALRPDLSVLVDLDPDSKHFQAWRRP